MDRVLWEKQPSLYLSLEWTDDAAGHVRVLDARGWGACVLGEHEIEAELLRVLSER